MTRIFDNALVSLEISTVLPGGANLKLMWLVNSQLSVENAQRKSKTQVDSESGETESKNLT